MVGREDYKRLLNFLSVTIMTDIGGIYKKFS